MSKDTIANLDVLEAVDEIYRRWFQNFPDKEQINEFHAALGRAIASWALVEEQLFSVFSTAAKPGSSAVLSAAFHALQHTNSKLAATDAAVRVVLLGIKDEAARAALEGEWNVVRRKVNNRLDRRNQIAHFSIHIDEQEADQAKKIRLKPLSVDARYMAGLKRPVEYSVHDLRCIANTFNRVSLRLMKFSQKLPRA
jgi:hypothetical protein